ncbi:MAG: sensor histidine kinase, partial [Cyanophyceae cyanobacterium]
ANAIDAVEEGLSTPVVTSGGVLSSSQPQPQIVVTTQVRGDRQVVTISDNGPGIHPELCDRIFDPFFTTKPTGKGSGMGLAISYQIVTDRHGGQIFCTSEPGQGTIFTVEIPVKSAAGSSRDIAGVDKPPANFLFKSPLASRGERSPMGKRC